MHINENIINAASFKLGIPSPFIEKDFYVVEVLKALSGFDYNDTQLIFSGGTSLSKAQKLIKRFSEDIDFRVNAPDNFKRKDRKAYWSMIINQIKGIEVLKIKDDTIFKRDEHKFCSFEVEYPLTMVIPNYLRPHLKLEFSFEPARLPVQRHKVNSFIGDLSDKYQGCECNCISPVEIGGNKLSALMWRIDIKDRAKDINTIKNDPTIIRHLHDLAALEPYLSTEKFVDIVIKSFESDQGRSGSNKDIALLDFALQTHEKLKNDPLYESEYENFVGMMSYAKESQLGFKAAVDSFGRIVEYITPFYK